jgi:hypothetical protein
MPQIIDALNELRNALKGKNASPNAADSETPDGPGKTHVVFREDDRVMAQLIDQLVHKVPGIQRMATALNDAETPQAARSERASRFTREEAPATPASKPQAITINIANEEVEGLVKGIQAVTERIRSSHAIQRQLAEAQTMVAHVQRKPGMSAKIRISEGTTPKVLVDLSYVEEGQAKLLKQILGENPNRLTESAGMREGYDVSIPMDRDGVLGNLQRAVMLMTEPPSMEQRLAQRRRETGSDLGHGDDDTDGQYGRPRRSRPWSLW